MKIRTSTREIEVRAILGETIKNGNHQYPAMKIVMPGGISDEELGSLFEGSFTIIDEEENEYVHEGYNTLKEVSVTIMKFTQEESQIEELEAQLAAVQAQIDAANAELASTKNEINTARTELENAKTAATTARAELDNVRSELETTREENTVYQKEIEALEVENAELLFNKLTTYDWPSSDETTEEPQEELVEEEPTNEE